MHGLEDLGFRFEVVTGQGLEVKGLGNLLDLLHLLLHLFHDLRERPAGEEERGEEMRSSRPRKPDPETLNPIILDRKP